MGSNTQKMFSLTPKGALVATALLYADRQCGATDEEDKRLESEAFAKLAKAAIEYASEVIHGS